MVKQVTTQDLFAVRYEAVEVLLTDATDGV